jgi:hypothetical protein
VLSDNPFAALSFIAGPALLTNATSLLLLSTINRYGRALDRARLLAAKIAGEDGGSDPAEMSLWRHQLELAQLRVVLILRTLTFFYTAIGAFSLGTLAYLVGATLLAGFGGEGVASMVMLGASTLGVLCLIGGSGVLVWESRLSFQILRDEAQIVLKRARAV